MRCFPYSDFIWMFLANRMSLPLGSFVEGNWHIRCWCLCYHREMRTNNDFNSVLLSEQVVQVSYGNFRNIREQDNNLPFSLLPSKWSFWGSNIFFPSPVITWVSLSKIMQEMGRYSLSFWETNQKLHTSFALNSYPIPFIRTQLYSSHTWLKGKTLF